MKKYSVGVVGLVMVCMLAGFAGLTFAGPESEGDGGDSNAAIERARNAKKGELKNPFTDNKEAIAQGKKIYMGYSCNGCHGGTGGGGMCPPLSNDVWIYGSDDDTLYRLIALGTDELMKQGYKRVRTEKVKGPMPAFGKMVESEDEIWKMIAWIRTTFRGSPERRNW